MSKRTNSNGSQSSGSTVYAVVDGKRVALDYAAARALALNAHLLSLGDPKRAAEMLAEAKRAEHANVGARGQGDRRDRAASH